MQKIAEVPPNGDEVGFNSKIRSEVGVEVFKPFLGAVISLKNGRQKMQVSFGRIAHANSFEGSAGRVERNSNLSQAPERDTSQVVFEVVFDTISTTENAREGSHVVVESPAGRPRVNPSFAHQSPRDAW